MKKYGIFTVLAICIFLIGCNTNKQTAIDTHIPTSTITETVQPTATTTPVPTITPTQIPTAFGGYKTDRLIVYVCGTEELCVSSLDGKNEINLSANLPNVDQKDIYIIGWSPDGARILFNLGTSATWTENCGLWEIKPDGSDPKLLIPWNKFSDGAIWFDVKWNPDGKHFLTIIPNKDAYRNEEIGVYDITSFSMNTTGNFGYSPQYSPDGKYYAFVKFAQKIELYVVDENNPTPFLVKSFEFPNQLGLGGNFLWSSDSKSLIFSFGNNISQIGIDGNNEELLIDLPEKSIDFKFSQYSPDGRYLIFDYSSINGRTSYPAILNFEKKSVTIPPVGSLFWTPDNHLIYHDWRTDNKDMFIMNPDTGEIAFNNDIKSSWLLSFIQP